MGKTGADAEQPFSLSQPNREELFHLSLAVWGSGSLAVRIGFLPTCPHSNSIPTQYQQQPCRTVLCRQVGTLLHIVPCCSSCTCLCISLALPPSLFPPCMWCVT
jgi:hypothetical protein